MWLNLNSSSKDELGNWCHERLMGPLGKYEAKQRGFHGDPVSMNKPYQRPPTSTVTLKELQWKYLPNIMSNFQQRWEGQGSKFAREATEKIHNDGKAKADGA